MPKVFNRAGMSTATTGTGTLTLGSALTGYQSFADAGASNSDTLAYLIEEGNSWELGTGTYTASGTTLSRSVLESSNSDSALNLAGTAQVFIVPSATDLQNLIDFKNATSLPTSDGTAGQTLVTNGAGAASWTSIPLVGISTTTASASATVDIALPSTYSKFKLVLENVTAATDAVTFHLRVSFDAGSTYVSTGTYPYKTGYRALNGTGSSGYYAAGVYDNGATSILLTGGSSIGNAAGEGFNGTFDIFSGSSTARFFAHGNMSWVNSSGQHVFAALEGGSSTTADTVDYVRFYLSSGNIAAGDFHLYGVKDP